MKSRTSKGWAASCSGRVMTKEITDGGLITADGTLIPGDMVIITIGESPDLGYLPKACGNSAIGPFPGRT